MPKEENHDRELLAYLPRTITDWYQAAPLGQRHTFSRLSGVLVCLDASGFTALTTQLHQHGRQGPELLTNLLNQFFETLCSVAFQHNGDVLRFAGDAMWIYFPHSFNPQTFLTEAVNSWEEAAKLDLIASEHPVRIHVGAEAGEFWLASLGDQSTMMVAEPLGELVSEVFRLCDLASENQLALGPGLMKEADYGDPESSSRGYHIISRGDLSNNYKVAPVAPEPAPKVADWVRPYISEEIYARVQSGSSQSRPQSEHRQVCTMFVYVEGQAGQNIDQSEEYYAQFNESVSEVIRNIIETGGSVGQIDPYKTGHKILAMFGAPKKREDDELRAIACASAIAKLNSEVCPLRIGLAMGSLYCGDVGSTVRREYTVIGAGTNRAARLTAQAAWGEVIMDDKLFAKLPAEVRTQKVMFSLKGIGSEVACYKLLGIADSGQAAVDTKGLIGRQAELNSLSKSWAATGRGNTNIVSVYGEAGGGKTNLINQFISIENFDSKPVLLSGKRSILYEHGWLARKVLIDLYHQSRRSKTVGFVKHAQGVIEPNWWPLLADIFEQSIDENEWTRGLSPALRNEKTAELYAQLADSMVKSRQLVVIDDFDKADARSTSLIRGLLESSLVMPLMFVIISRDKIITLPDLVDRHIELPVKAPSADEWWAYFLNQFDDRKREREFFARLLKVSANNPHCVVDYIERCRAGDIIGMNPVTSRLELVKAGFKVIIPEDLKDHHLALFDQLPEPERAFLKVAAVMGMSFQVKQLLLVINSQDEKTAVNSLENSVRAGLLDWDSEAQSYSFRYSSMRDAIYDCIPQQVLKKTHQQIGEVLELVHGARRPDILANHFIQAEQLVRAFPYSLKAAGLALASSSLSDLARSLNRCTLIMKSESLSSLAWTAVREFYSLKNEFLVLEGDYSAAYANLRGWRKAALLNSDFDSGYLACTTMAKILFVQSKYDRSRRVLKTILATPKLSPTSWASSLAILAEVERRTGSVEAAIGYAREAIRIASGLEDTQVMSEALNNLGLALWGKGQLAEAAEAYEQCLQLPTIIESQYAKARLVNNLAIIYWELGDFKRARSLMQRSLDVFQNVGDRRNEAYCSGNLASLSRIAGRIQEAKKHFEMADLIFERLGDKHAHYYTVGNLGDIDMVLGAFDSAERRYDETISFAQSVGDQELVAECLARAGELAFFNGDWAKAEEKLQAGIELASKISSSEYFIRAAIGMARLCIGLKADDRVQILVDQVNEEVAKSKAIAAGHEAEFIAAELHRIKGERSAAINCLTQVLQFAEEQEFFELNLFSLVRLYELEVDKQPEHRLRIKDLLSWYESTNGHGSQAKLLASPFFRYFVDTLQAIIYRIA